MTELKIIGWTDFECEYPTKKLSNEELNQVIYLIREEIIENGYLFSGEEHQNSFTGVPVFSDGTCLRASMRAWGLIMSQCYQGPDGKELSYMDFYMSLGDISRLPEHKELNVEPQVVDEESSGLTIKADRQVIDESLSFGMTFLTTDKVLKSILEKMNEN
jgi:hypothetical protein